MPPPQAAFCALPSLLCSSLTRNSSEISITVFFSGVLMCRKYPEGISPSRGWSLQCRAHWPVLPYTLLDVHGLGRGAEGDALHIHGRPPPARTCRPWPRRDLLFLRAAADVSDAVASSAASSGTAGACCSARPCRAAHRPRRGGTRNARQTHVNRLDSFLFGLVFAVSAVLCAIGLMLLLPSAELHPHRASWA